MSQLITVVEMPAFAARVSKLLSDEGLAGLTWMLAADPKCGDLLTGTGGVRKVRFAVEGRGKSGGVRVVYFFKNEGMPVFLIAIFGKNEKSNLSKAERNAVAKIAALIETTYGK